MREDEADYSRVWRSVHQLSVPAVTRRVFALNIFLDKVKRSARKLYVSEVTLEASLKQISVLALNETPHGLETRLSKISKSEASFDMRMDARSGVFNTPQFNHAAPPLLLVFRMSETALNNLGNKLCGLVRPRISWMSVLPWRWTWLQIWGSACDRSDRHTDISGDLKPSSHWVSLDPSCSVGPGTSRAECASDLVKQRCVLSTERLEDFGRVGVDGSRKIMRKSEFGAAAPWPHGSLAACTCIGWRPCRRGCRIIGVGSGGSDAHFSFTHYFL